MLLLISFILELRIRSIRLVFQLGDLLIRLVDALFPMMTEMPSGSLSSVLSMISDYGVNLTEIHSAPNRQEHWNYRFYVELSANLLKKDIQALVFQLMNETEEFTIIGSYACDEEQF